MLTIAVADMGIGIKKDSIPFLFEAFKRVDEENNRYIEGTGLGLSIVNSILNLHEVKYSIKVKDNVFTFKAVFNG
jgi:signal transduction histidine kinase